MHTQFFGTAAQVIPTLLVALVLVFREFVKEKPRLQRFVSWAVLGITAGEVTVLLGQEYSYGTWAVVVGLITIAFELAILAVYAEIGTGTDEQGS